MDQGSNSGGEEVFCAHPDRIWVPHSLLYNGYGFSFPGLKWPGRGVDHPPQSRAKIKERVELSLFPLRAIVADYRVKFYLRPAKPMPK